MQLHEIKPIHKLKGKKRIGRGGKRGTYSGNGQKGQKSRAGRKFQPVIRQIIKRYPKLRGYKVKELSTNTVILNVENLEKNFKTSEIVSPKILLNLGLIRRIKGRTPQVKILGKGEIKKALTIKECTVSKSAKEKIENAGGKIV